MRKSSLIHGFRWLWQNFVDFDPKISLTIVKKKQKTKNKKKKTPYGDF